MPQVARMFKISALSRGVLRYDDTGRVGQQISSSQRSQRLNKDMIDSSKDTKDSTDISKDGTEICHVVTKDKKMKTDETI